jgi:hypothetical protein
VITEDPRGMSLKWLYGAAEGLDGNKYCLVQFEGNEYIDVVPPRILVDHFPYVQNFYGKDVIEQPSA